MRRKEQGSEVALPKGRAPIISHLKAGNNSNTGVPLTGSSVLCQQHNVLHTSQPHSTFSGCTILPPVPNTQWCVCVSIHPVWAGVPPSDNNYLLNRFGLVGRFLPHKAALPTTRPSPPEACSWPFGRVGVLTLTDESVHRMECKKYGTKVQYGR